jgi:hypothetical protein
MPCSGLEARCDWLRTIRAYKRGCREDVDIPTAGLVVARCNPFTSSFSHHAGFCNNCLQLSSEDTILEGVTTHDPLHDQQKSLSIAGFSRLVCLPALPVRLPRRNATSYVVMIPRICPSRKGFGFPSLFRSFARRH